MVKSTSREQKLTIVTPVQKPNLNGIIIKKIRPVLDELMKERLS